MARSLSQPRLYLSLSSLYRQTRTSVPAEFYHLHHCQISEICGICFVDKMKMAAVQNYIISQLRNNVNFVIFY